MKYNNTLPGLGKIKEIDHTKCWQGSGALELSYIADRKEEWYSHFDKQFGSFLKVNYTLTIWSSHSTTKYCPKINGAYVHTMMYM